MPTVTGAMAVVRVARDEQPFRRRQRMLLYRTRCVNPVWLAWVTVLQGGEHGTDEQWPRAAA